MISDAIIGNSSSGIIEIPSLNIPVVNIGMRQKGRVKSDCIIDVDFNKDEMLSPSDLAETIFHTIVSPNSSVVEDVVVRRTAGDF